MSNPHRISLSKAWTPNTNQSNLLQVQRLFHKPTNLGSDSSVRLRITSHSKLQSVYLNQLKLAENPCTATENARQAVAENSSQFGYDWEITAALKLKNDLILCWLNPTPNTLEPPPKFEVWLEIFAH